MPVKRYYIRRRKEEVALLKKNEGYLNDYAALCKEADRLEPEMFDRYEVQGGLRDQNGNRTAWEIR